MNPLEIAGRLAKCVLPTWSRLLTYVLIATVVFCLGVMQDERRAGLVHVDYITKQAAQRRSGSLQEGQRWTEFICFVTSKWEGG